ncbi:tetratricopeptide repeat protein [Lapidilactobacillus mulanensis]|uniref:hypothetical protein n=1 Tax=Lapidilactobacillus mulanensis TaxID=2485999 RepID=UPI000F79DD51|nr:hypothetical protein [Lapidilactobacillus mulanensis]
MAEFPETVKSLVALAKEAVAKQDFDQAMRYYQRTLQLDPPFDVVQDYLQLLLQVKDLDEARSLLADFGGLFIANGRLIYYWQALLQVDDYLGFDQSLDWLKRQDYRLDQSEQAQWTELQQQMMLVQFTSEKLAKLTADLLLATTTEDGNWHQALQALKLLTPVAYLQVVEPSLVSANLNIAARVTILNEISQFSQVPELKIWWRGELRSVVANELVPLQSVELFQELIQSLEQYAQSHKIDQAQQQFVFSNITTYVWLTYPFCQTELTPIDIWREFLFSGQIPGNTSFEQRDQIQFWQEEEQKMLKQLNS